MRRCGKSPSFVEDDGKVLGITLPADYCAEHEWGIEKLNNLFGITKENKVGLESRQATKVPNKEKDSWNYRDFMYEEKNGMAALTVGFHIFQSKNEKEKTLFDQLPYELQNRVNSKSEEFIEGAWCEESFGILVKGENNIKKLRLVRDAIESINVAIFLGGGRNIFENAGLVIAFVDTFPADSALEMKQKDEDRINLHEAAKATGIEEKVCAALKGDFGGKPFYALSPRWKSNQNTKHKVVFWLNPTDQQKNNYGWFTVEELEQWIEGKGPIPMKKKKAK